MQSASSLPVADHPGDLSCPPENGPEYLKRVQMEPEFSQLFFVASNPTKPESNSLLFHHHQGLEAVKSISSNYYPKQAWKGIFIKQFNGLVNVLESNGLQEVIFNFN